MYPSTFSQVSNVLLFPPSFFLKSAPMRVFLSIIRVMILGTINCDRYIWCYGVFRLVSMLGDKGSTKLLPVCLQEQRDLLLSEFFWCLQKLQCISAYGQRHFQFFDGTQIAHYSYTIWLLKEDAIGTRHLLATPAAKFLVGQFICFIDYNAQRIPLSEITRISTIAKKARVETFAFHRQVIEFWMIGVSLRNSSRISSMVRPCSLSSGECSNGPRRYGRR